MHDSSDREPRNRVPSGKCANRLASGMGRANIDHLIPGEFCPTMIRAARMPTAALPLHVGNIVGLYTKKQMRRVAARRVIAMVHHSEPVDAFLREQNHGNPVSERALSAKAENPVTVSVSGPRPEPAVSRAIEARQEPC